MKLIFAWRAFLVGFLYNRENRRLYFSPIPMVGIVFQFGNRKGHLPDIFKNKEITGQSDSVDSVSRAVPPKCPECHGVFGVIETHNGNCLRRR